MGYSNTNMPSSKKCVVSKILDKCYLMKIATLCNNILHSYWLLPLSLYTNHWSPRNSQILTSTPSSRVYNQVPISNCGAKTSHVNLQISCWWRQALLGKGLWEGAWFPSGKYYYPWPCPTWKSTKNQDTMAFRLVHDRE